MSNSKALQQERMALRQDLVAHKIPKRVPLFLRFSADAACGLAGVDMMRAHYDIDQMEKAYTAVCDNFYSDAIPVSNIRYPAATSCWGPATGSSPRRASCSTPRSRCCGWRSTTSTSPPPMPPL